MFRKLITKQYNMDNINFDCPYKKLPIFDLNKKRKVEDCLPCKKNREKFQKMLEERKKNNTIT
jgi:hypothetical protein